MLDKQKLIDLLIRYDSEHPVTLGEMADRRSIYAQRILDLTENPSIVFH